MGAKFLNMKDTSSLQTQLRSCFLRIVGLTTKTRNFAETIVLVHCKLHGASNLRNRFIGSKADKIEMHVKLCVTARFSRKVVFAPKIGKMDQKWAKNRVF